MAHVITELYAFVSVDNDDNDEGIIAFQMPNGPMMPMIGSDLARVADLKKRADEMGINYKVKYFKLEEQ